jgi:hypothetical protein
MEVVVVGSGAWEGGSRRVGGWREGGSGRCVGWFGGVGGAGVGWFGFDRWGSVSVKMCVEDKGF